MNWEQNISPLPGKRRKLEKKLQPHLSYIEQSPVLEEDPGHLAADEVLRSKAQEEASRQSGAEHARNERYMKKREKEYGENHQDILDTYGRKE